MTTPRIEEILVEAKEIGNTDISTEDVPKFLRVYKFTNEELTQIIVKAHQAGIDEAVEIVEKQKLTEPLYVGETQYRFYKGDISWVVNQALDDTIKALQNNK